MPETGRAAGRAAQLRRTTNETDIELALDLDGTGAADVRTGCGFLDHMLELFAHHGRFDVRVRCTGDTQVDYHHSVEDVGIALGSVFAEALGDKRGIARYGQCLLPMDEALVLTAVDFSGRAYLGFSVEMPCEKVGDFDTELVKEFWAAFVREARCTLHFRELAGENTHHVIEACFKSAARSMRGAVAIDAACAGVLPSTKGVL